MSWFPDKREWHIHTRRMFERLPDLGIDGKPLFSTPEEYRIMRRIIDGQKQYRAATPDELREDYEDWASGVF